MTKILVIPNFGKYLGKSFDTCLQLDLNKCGKGLLPTLVCIYEIHSTRDFRQPTYGKQREKIYITEKEQIISSENVLN